MKSVVQISNNTHYENALRNASIRLIFCAIFLSFSFLTLTLRLLDLSFLNLDELPKIHSKDSNKKNNFRKDIIDRNGVLIASSIPTASVFFDTKHIINAENTARQLSNISYINYDKIVDKLNSGKSFTWFKRHISPSEQQRIHDLGMPGIHFVKDYKRVYPHNNLFSHIIGLADIDGKGISGIERSFDEYLLDENSDNETLQLSIDARIQYHVKEELNNAINLHNAIGGSAIVMDISTGEILSLVSLPDFNPNNIKKIDPQTMFNQITSGIYEMGSVFKPLSLAIAYDLKKISTDDVFDVSQPLIIDRFKITDYRGGKGGELSVPEILMYSSNLGTAQITQLIGIKHQREYLRKLGLLSKFSFELPETSRSIYPKESRWKEVNSITIGYGHGIAVTPIHFVRAFASILNGGILRNPTLLKHNDVKYDEKRVFQKETSETMKKLLRLTVKGGFAGKAEVPGYLVGGKTGTAEKVVDGKYSKKLNIALCATGFPMHAPKYLVLVLIDEAKRNKINNGFTTGGMIAAPVVSNIISKIATILNIQPKEETDPKILQALHIDYKPRYKRLAKR